jgi:hypothetical protein
MVATGEWGSDYVNRLWNWSGQPFRSHEPAMLMGQGQTQKIEGIKFDHYSYVFDQDVKFKSRYYSGHESVYENWLKIQKEVKDGLLKLPCHISALFGDNSKYSKLNSYIHEI